MCVMGGPLSGGPQSEQVLVLVSCALLQPPSLWGLGSASQEAIRSPRPRSHPGRGGGCSAGHAWVPAGGRRGTPVPRAGSPRGGRGPGRWDGRRSGRPRRARRMAPPAAFGRVRSRPPVAALGIADTSAQHLSGNGGRDGADTEGCGAQPRDSGGRLCLSWQEGSESHRGLSPCLCSLGGSARGRGGSRWEGSGRFWPLG